MAALPAPPANDVIGAGAGAGAGIGAALGLSAPLSTPPARPTSATVTPNDPLYAQAVAQAQAALQAEQAPLLQQQQASDAYYAARQKDAIDAYTTLSNLLQKLNIGGQIQGAYQTAGQDTALMGDAVAAGMKDSLQGSADGINSLLDKIGAPSGQQVGGNIPDAAGALATIYGALPGQSFEKQGAAQAAAADILPAIALGQGRDQFKAVAASGAAAHQDFNNKLADLAAKLPGDIQTNYQTLQKMALDNSKFAESIRKDNADIAAKKAATQLAIAKYSTSVKEFNVRTGQAAQRLQLDAQRLANTEFNQNRQYGLSLARIGIEKARLQQTIISNSFKAANGGLTPAKVSAFQSKAASIAMDSFNGHTTYSTVNGKKVAQTSAQLTYAEALQNELRTGMPVQIALDALDAVYPPADRPTPEILAKALGPLEPTALKQLVQTRLSYGQVAAGEAAGALSEISSGHAGGFLPTNVTYSLNRTDQGRDIQTVPGAPIVAPGDGVVVRVASDPGSGGAHFGPSYPVVRFTSGPYKGQTMYIGHTVAALQPGQKFRAGQTISHTGHGGPESGGAPPGWAEIGFAPGGTPGKFGQKSPF